MGSADGEGIELMKELTTCNGSNYSLALGAALPLLIL